MMNITVQFHKSSKINNITKLNNSKRVFGSPILADFKKDFMTQ